RRHRRVALLVLAAVPRRPFPARTPRAPRIPHPRASGQPERLCPDQAGRDLRMNIDLKELTQLAPTLRDPSQGYHISRAAPELYTRLSSQQDAYRALFRSLGYELVCDSRGFYYFVPEQMGAQVNKTAQRLALFTFILVEHLADQGRDPLAVLDGGSLGRDELPALLDKYRDLFLQAEVTTQDELEEKVIRRLTQLGF